MDKIVTANKPRETIAAYGTTMGPKGPATLRIMTQNPNEFRSLSVTEDIECVGVMKELNLDLLALPDARN